MPNSRKNGARAFVTTNEPMIGIVPYAYNTTFWIGCDLYTKCPELHTYTLGVDLLYSGDVIQMFVPKSRADLDLNGIVDVEDLAALAMVYGTIHPWGSLATPLNIVDIYDLAYVAKRYLDP